ncbi:MAG: Tex family protein [Chloroflexota bacterium]|nr:Tex family protein [Chloroflexota bacterium]
MHMNYTQRISTQLNLRPAQVAATIELLDAGNTLPFIARYRKEMTSGLDEEQLRQLSTLLARLQALDKRRQTIVASIEAQGKLTPELHQQLLAADTRTTLEDLYQPYKPKRRTRASVAREKGLQGLADLILQQARTRQTVAQIAAPFLTPDVPTVEETLVGARDIVAETISDHPQVRRLTREKALQWGMLRSEKAEKGKDPRGVYQVYYDFEWRVNRLRPHQVLAINRGEAEKVLRVHVDIPERDWRAAIGSTFRPDRRSPLAGQLALAADDGAQRLLLPAIERDVRRFLTEQAEAHAISVFAANLRALLNQPPLAGHTVLGIDPGFRTGCKVAVVDPTGKVLDTATIYPHEPQKQWDATLHTLAVLIAQHHVTLIAIGNGTASRETEQLVAELIHALGQAHEGQAHEGQAYEGQAYEGQAYEGQAYEGQAYEGQAYEGQAQGLPLRYIIVSEAGASVYSASPLARAELPGMDVSIRGAVSIARRVQDPLAELVKINPQSIGVGLYQHDVNQAQLNAALAGAVESVVNSVGVDVNTASPALLTHVAGIGPKLAARIVAHRDANGPFPNRMALRSVPGIGSKTFEQAVGFLRVHGGDNPLDGSAIHPESYPIAEAVLKRAGLTPQAEPAEREDGLAELQARQPLSVLAAELGTGVPTLTDILEQLIRPGRDPRKDLPVPILRSDVLTMDDLQPGLLLKGTVRNVVDFGAFVDVGVKHDGLLHRSQMPTGTRLKVGGVIEVEILRVEPERGRIALGWPGTGAHHHQASEPHRPTP